MWIAKLRFYNMVLLLGSRYTNIQWDCISRALLSKAYNSVSLTYSQSPTTRGNDQHARSREGEDILLRDTSTLS